MAILNIKINCSGLYPIVNFKNKLTGKNNEKRKCINFVTNALNIPCNSLRLFCTFLDCVFFGFLDIQFLFFGNILEIS